ncbi:MAG: tetratricopeptide repeat protein [Myxococcota bacterium]
MPADTGPAAKKLHEALTALQSNQPDAARAAGEEALEGFSMANDRTGAAAAHQLLAMLRVQAGDLDGALAHIDAAAPLREATGDWEGLAALHQERFEVYVRRGDLDGAKEAAEGQLAAQKKAGHKEGIAHACHQLAQVLLQQGDDKAAESLVQDALWTVTGPGTERAQSALCLLYATINTSRGDHDRAVVRARQALELARQAKNKGAEVDALQHLGAILAAKGETRLARRTLEEALVGRELMKDVEGRASVLRELAGVELQLGENDEAFAHLHYAVKSLREAGNWIGEVTMLQVVQAAADEYGRPELALSAAHATVEAAARTGDREAEAAAHFTLATRLAGAGMLENALEHFEKARDIQLGLGLGHEAAVAGGMIGQVQVAMGRRDDGIANIKGSLAQLDAIGSEAAETLREILGELES